MQIKLSMRLSHSKALQTLDKIIQNTGDGDLKTKTIRLYNEVDRISESRNIDHFEEQEEVSLRDAGDEFAKAIEKHIPEYDSPAFKCLSDYKKCKLSNRTSVCVLMLIVCLGERIIPLAGLGK